VIGVWKFFELQQPDTDFANCANGSGAAGPIRVPRVAFFPDAMRPTQPHGKPLVGTTCQSSKPRRTQMTPCELCGNTYDKSFEVRSADGTTHTFDSFECAIHVLAPTCSHCNCRIIGHGIESDGTYYCCAYCARMSGVHQAVDRVEVS
jgi:hypothetical protein